MYNPDYFSKEKLEEIQMQDMYFDQIVIPAQNAYESLLRKYKKSTIRGKQMSANNKRIAISMYKN